MRVKCASSERESCAGIRASFTNDAYASNARHMRDKYAGIRASFTNDAYANTAHGYA